MLVAKRHGREKPTKIEQQKVKGRGRSQDGGGIGGGRSLSLLQIHRKNNRTVNKVHKTTSDR